MTADKGKVPVLGRLGSVLGFPRMPGARKHVLLAIWVLYVFVIGGMSLLGGLGTQLGATGDVFNVYEPWSRWVFEGYTVGIDAAWVYPQVALIPMIAVRAFFFLPTYLAQWAALVFLLHTIAFAMLLGRRPSVGRMWAAVFWIVATAALGYVSLFRIEGITVPLAVVALLWLWRRPTTAAVLLAIGTWIKVWPAALIAAAFVGTRHRVRIVVGSAAVTAIVIGAVLLLGGGAHLFGFLGEQSGRGMQVEAPLALPFVWGAMMHVKGTSIYFNRQIITHQVVGPGSDAVAAATTPLMVLGMIALAVLGFVLVRRGVRSVRLVPPLALAMVLVLILANKVGSPQFQSWLIAPLVLWLVVDRARAWRYAAAGIGAFLLTQLVFPIFYAEFLEAQPVLVAAMTLRDLILVFMLVSVVRHLGALRAPADARVTRAAADE